MITPAEIFVLVVVGFIVFGGLALNLAELFFGE